MFGLISRLTLLVLCGGWLAGCATLPVPTDKPLVNEQVYTAAHPYYFEFCALSEIQKKPGYGADIRAAWADTRRCTSTAPASSAMAARH